jgi:hypothetical protein
MANKKHLRSIETSVGMPFQHLKQVVVAQMDDNIVEVIPGIFGEIQPTGCIIFSQKIAGAMPTKEFGLTVNRKGLQFTV